MVHQKFQKNRSITPLIYISTWLETPGLVILANQTDIIKIIENDSKDDSKIPVGFIIIGIRATLNSRDCFRRYRLRIDDLGQFADERRS